MEDNDLKVDERVSSSRLTRSEKMSLEELILQTSRKQDSEKPHQDTQQRNIIPLEAAETFCRAYVCVSGGEL